MTRNRNTNCCHEEQVVETSSSHAPAQLAGEAGVSSAPARTHAQYVSVVDVCLFQLLLSSTALDKATLVELLSADDLTVFSEMQVRHFRVWSLLACCHN